MQCVYKNCGNNSRTSRRAKGLSFHPFPKVRTQKAKFERWVQNCGVGDQHELGRTGYVCSLHFQDSAPTNANPDPIPWDELSLDVALKKKSKKQYLKTIVIDDDVPMKTLNTTASKDLILDLDCTEEDVFTEQSEFYKKEEREYSEVVSKFEQLIKQNSGDVIHRSDSIIAAQYLSYGNPPALAPLNQSNGPSDASSISATASTISNQSSVSQSGGIIIQNKGMPAANTTYQLVMDPRLGFIVGTMTPTGTTVVQPTAVVTSGTTTVQTQSKSTTQPPSPQVRHSSRKRGRPTGPPQLTQPAPPLPVPIPQTQATVAAAAVAAVRPTESTAVGGLTVGGAVNKPPAPAAVVDLTSDDGRTTAADSREIAFNKLQGKTYPSLVVVARPNLHARESAALNDRPALDARVKQVLVYSPTKFTEWLIQQGLVRSEQACDAHPQMKLNLGMYSDVGKFPYSGGYVWISECCPQRFVSVFNGSIFESSQHAPAVILKLIYHWACQTNIQNVVQWVKVDNLYAKGVFTWLRAACTLALQKNLPTMGGPQKRIEVGVISLGTTSQDGAQRQVKVEVLGILDSEAKLIRLRAVEPLADGDRNYKRRFSKILEPLRQWVHAESMIATDLTVDKGTLQQMGFAHVIQGGQSGNQAVMDYLRKIVPRMFQNTLSLLSRQIIQQFLDELVWREWFGQTANQAFSNMCLHLAEQTRLTSHDSLLQRLNKVAASPFKNHWATYCGGPVAVQVAAAITPTPISRPGPASKRKRVSAIIDLERPAPVMLQPPAKRVAEQPLSSAISDTTDAMVPLESYYYGTMEGDLSNPLAQKVTLNVRCCVCKVPYVNNIRLLDHLLAHAHNISTKAAATQCHYCLASLATPDDLNRHIGDVHPTETRTRHMAGSKQQQYTCVICEQVFTSVYMLGKHMSRTHVQQELPYQCGTCGYRCSSHRRAVDHFYREHDGATTVQCPFCLKSTTVWSAGRVMSTNVTFFLAHLQKHQKKTTARKCPQCALWFIHKDTLKEHQTKSHESLARRKNVQPCPLPGDYVLVPRSKVGAAGPIGIAVVGAPSSVGIPSANTLTTAAVSAIHPRITTSHRPMMPENTQHKAVLIVPTGSTCKECTKDMMKPDHYPRKLSCTCCRYITDCMYAMYRHKTKCTKLPKVRKPMPRLQLSEELHCVCGWSSDDGNQVAKHLALCERKTAYPTAECAHATTTTTQNSMLDVLGLVRRNDDKQVEIITAMSIEETSQDTRDNPTEEGIDAPSLEHENVEPKIEITETQVTAVD